MKIKFIKEWRGRRCCLGCHQEGLTNIRHSFGCAYRGVSPR